MDGVCGLIQTLSAIHNKQRLDNIDRTDPD